METGWLQWGYHQAHSWGKKTTARLLRRQHSRQGYEQTSAEPLDEGTEDEDVREERQALQAGGHQPALTQLQNAVADVPNGMT